MGHIRASKISSISISQSSSNLNNVLKASFIEQQTWEPNQLGNFIFTNYKTYCNRNTMKEKNDSITTKSRSNHNRKRKQWQRKLITNNHSTTQNSLQYFPIVITCSLCLAISYKATRLQLSHRIHDLAGGFMLLAAAGNIYLWSCLILYWISSFFKRLEKLHILCQLLIERMNYISWWPYPGDRLRFFVEVACWMASVWCLYAISHIDAVAIIGGAISALLLACISDVLSVYTSMVEAQLDQEEGLDIGQNPLSWIKVCSSYLCVGYVVSGNACNLINFLMVENEELPKLKSIEDLVMNYVLIILVGVSLIVASELLLLYRGTRQAGLLLQSRIVHARHHWEDNTVRSMIEASIIFSVTVATFHVYQDVRWTLQVGTGVALLVILGGEGPEWIHAKLHEWKQENFHMSNPNYTSISSTTKAISALPGDHWVKLLPLIVMMTFLCYRVGSALINLPFNINSNFLMFCSFIWICVLLGVINAASNSTKWESVSQWFKSTIDRILIAGITILAYNVCTTWEAVIFSAWLSWFSINLATEVLNDFQQAVTSTTHKGLYYEDCEETDVESNESERLSVQIGSEDASFSLTNASFCKLFAGCQKTIGQEGIKKSSKLVSFVKKRFPYVYERFKWTFIFIALLSFFDISATLLFFIHDWHDSDKGTTPTLSQLSAGNVVLSSGVGYLISSCHKNPQLSQFLHIGLHQAKIRWLSFPLHAFVEGTIFVGVFLGSLAAASTVFASLTLASLSSIIVSVGGRFVCSRLKVSSGQGVQVRLTATYALVFMLLLATYGSALCLFFIYRCFESIEAAFCLASLAGVVFVAFSELFLLWEPTREIGHILQQRVTHAKENWETEPVRSFLEFFTWLAVIYGCFALYGDLLLALQCGTFSGIVVTLSGEYFRRNQGVLFDVVGDEKKNMEETNERSRVLPIVLLFAYIGSGAFQWVFENMRSLELLLVLATIAGIAFLCIGDVLARFQQTRWAGVILQDRFLHAKSNWKAFPIRSFVEAGCFLGVIYGSYAVYGDLFVAVQLGALSGALIILIGEQVRYNSPIAKTLALESDDKIQILPLPIMVLLGLVGAIAFNIIYTHLRSIEVTFLLATTSGVAFAVIGDMFVIWPPTRKLGLILQERIVNSRQNWQKHPMRSYGELLSCGIAWYCSYVFLWPSDLLIAMQFGTFTGIFTCVVGHIILEYISNLEKRLRILNTMSEGQLRRRNKNSVHVEQTSLFFVLPYETQFEIASYLTPEDLLLVRLTCQSVNEMLCAEASRYWFHASLRRKRSYNHNTGQANSNTTRTHRSLVVEAVSRVWYELVQKNKKPSNLLIASGSSVSPAIKWVYLNANWIRHQKLQALDRPCTSDPNAMDLISLYPGDVAFDVFSHIPDKAYLGIVVEFKDTTIRSISVPFDVYENIQNDPISFVAAGTVSDVEAFSDWYLIVVAIFTMTCIIIGQFASDLIHSYLYA